MAGAPPQSSSDQDLVDHGAGLPQGQQQPALLPYPALPKRHAPPTTPAFSLTSGQGQKANTHHHNPVVVTDQALSADKGARLECSRYCASSSLLLASVSLLASCCVVGFVGGIAGVLTSLHCHPTPTRHQGVQPGLVGVDRVTCRLTTSPNIASAGPY